MKTEAMNEVFTGFIEEALQDYFILLNKGYPQKSILKMVGDRYKLSGSQRSILYRGICKDTEAVYRKVKIDPVPHPEHPLYIDGYNALITMANYLYGRPVFISNDGLLRDSGEVHGKIRKSKMFTRAVNILLTTLKELSFIEVSLYLDQPIPYSANLAKDINEYFTGEGIAGKATIVRYPDYHLKGVTSGSIASSDSVIIDKTPCRIFDLARYTLEHHYAPHFTKMDDILRT